MHSSLYSPSTAPISRMIASRLGKMPTTSVRRRISRLSLSCGLLGQIYRHPRFRECNERQDVLCSIAQHHR